jgi:hypothetical protein
MTTPCGYEPKTNLKMEKKLLKTKQTDQLKIK